FAIKRGTAAFEAVSDGTQQNVILEWLDEEIHGTGLHGFYCCGNISMTRNEDNRHFGALSCDYLLHFEAIKVRKRQIQDDAAGNKGRWATEKFPGRLKGLDLPAFAANQ